MTWLAAPDRYASMPYRRAGRSGLQLPAISLGLWHNFGADGARATQTDILLRAFDLGVTHFDLANNYGPHPGAAEETFGSVLARQLRPHRDEIVVSTKAGYDMWPGPYGEWGSRKHLLASLDASLRRLGTDYVDVFYHHRPDPSTPIEESMGALHTAVQQGKALYVGVSNYSPDETRGAAAALAGLGTPLLLHQPMYNMLERRIEDGLLDVLDEVGAGCVVFSPLAQGLLTDRYLDGVPADSRAAGDSPFLSGSRVTPELRATVRRLNEIAAARGQSLAQLALAWNLRAGRVTSVLVGASSVRQLENSVGAAAHLDLEADELAAIEAALAPDRATAGAARR